MIKCFSSHLPILLFPSDVAEVMRREGGRLVCKPTMGVDSGREEGDDARTGWLVSANVDVLSTRLGNKGANDMYCFPLSTSAPVKGEKWFVVKEARFESGLMGSLLCEQDGEHPLELGSRLGDWEQEHHARGRDPS